MKLGVQTLLPIDDYAYGVSWIFARSIPDINWWQTLKADFQISCLKTGPIVPVLLLFH